MRRMNDKEVIKANALVAIFSVLSILVGFFLPFLPVLLPAAEYDQLIDKQIVVQSVEWVHQNKGASYYLLTTADGEQYNITGDYTDAEYLEKSLNCGKTVSIKYYENEIFFTTKKYAEVIIADGETVVSYNNDDDSGEWVIYILASCGVLIGVGGICFVAWEVRRNRKDGARRNRQIARKYANKKDEV